MFRRRPESTPQLPPTPLCILGTVIGTFGLCVNGVAYLTLGLTGETVEEFQAAYLPSNPAAAIILSTALIALGALWIAWRHRKPKHLNLKLSETAFVVAIGAASIVPLWFAVLLVLS